MISTAKIAAVISFILGTILLLFFYFTNATQIAAIGYIYIVIAILINVLNLVLLAYKYYKDKVNRRKIGKAAGLILLNIPVAFLYFWLVLLLLNTMRITFINTTGTDITNITIDGCDAKTIKALAAGQSKEIWINIPHDCSISISYTINGMNKREDVTGYTTPLAGGISTYKIGTNLRKSSTPGKVSFITEVNIANATKDGIYLDGYVVNIGYEEAKKLNGKKIRLSGKVTIVKALKNLPAGDIQQGREEDSKYIASPDIEIISN